MRENALENLKLTSPEIQKDIANVAALEIVKPIIVNVGYACSQIFVNESRDIAMKE